MTLAAALRRAFDGAVGRMFRATPPDGPFDLDVTVAPSGDEVGDIIGGRTLLKANMLVASPAGAAIDEIACSGQATVLGSGHEAAVGAVDQASRALGEDFEHRFADSSRVFKWLQGNGIDPGDSALAWPARPDWIAFFDASVGPMIGAGDESAPGLLARFGVSARYFFVQGVIGRWSPGFQTAPSSNPTFTAAADLETNDVGLETGLRWRRGDVVELRAGGGAHGLWGTADPGTDRGSRTFSLVSPTIFAALQLTFRPLQRRFRIRTGFEVRQYFSATAGFPDLSRTIPVADTWIGFSLGVEIPIGSRPIRSAGGGE